MSSFLRRTVAALFAGALLVVPTVSAAADDGDVSWAAGPADADGPDGRSWVELELDPGATATEYLAVTNLGSAPATFALSAADGYFTSTGRFTMLPISEPSVAAGTWIELAVDQVTVDAGATSLVPFTVTVPDDATPGDHAAGVAAAVRSTSSSGTGVGVESRIGFRVMTRVSGELISSVDVSGVTAGYATSWRPFRGGVVEVGYVVVNDGNVGVLVDGSVSAGGRTVTAALAGGGSEITLLPGDRAEFTARVDGVWPTVRATGSVDVTAAVARDAQGEVNGVPVDEVAAPDPVSVGFSVWALPLPQLVVAFGVLLLVLALLGGRVRGRRRVERLVEAARAEGLAEGARTSVDEPDGSQPDDPVHRVPAAAGTDPDRPPNP